MNMKPIKITGQVHGYLNSGNPGHPMPGDCLLKRGANYTDYVDVFIYGSDGQLHILCLDHGNSLGRKFKSEAEIGPIMDRLKQRIQNLSGQSVDYGYPYKDAKKRAYHPKLMTFGEVMSSRFGNPF